MDLEGLSVDVYIYGTWPLCVCVCVCVCMYVCICAAVADFHDFVVFDNVQCRELVFVGYSTVYKLSSYLCFFRCS